MRRRRPLRDRLASPRTAAEERTADAHIRIEMERIQATWTPAERRKRAGLPERDRWSPPAVELTEEKLLDE